MGKDNCPYPKLGEVNSALQSYIPLSLLAIGGVQTLAISSLNVPSKMRNQMPFLCIYHPYGKEFVEYLYCSCTERGIKVL